MKDLQELIEQKANNHDLKMELSSLLKMLKTGFETSTKGMERVPKIYASNDNEKIMSYYNAFGNQINAMKISGNFEKFTEHMRVTFGINIEYTSEASPYISYVRKDKKLQKFKDLYSRYFLQDAPRTAVEAIEKILLSLDKLTKEDNAECDIIKESLREIIEGQSEHSPSTVKTMDKILTSARLKSLSVEDVANDAEEKLTLQQQGIDLVLKENSTEDEG
jgi:hypothetical protein